MSERWPRIQLDQLTETNRRVTYGVVKPGDHEEGGIAFVRGGDVFQGRIDVDKLRTISPQLSQSYKRTILRGGELLISLVGNPGEVAIAPPSLEGANIARQVGLIALRPGFNARFAMYFLMSPLGRAELFNRTGGAVQQVINLADLKTLKIPVPSKREQDRIASILSAYDDLMENNRRRMGLLEEAARHLYREWFVRLRFPGHQRAKVTNGLPAGWSKLALEAVCVDGDGIQTGPFGSQLHQSDYTPEGVPVVMPQDLINYRITEDAIARIPESLADKLGRHRMIPGDTVYGRRGDIGRRAFVSRRQAGWFCGTGSLRIRPNPEVIHPRFLFDTLGSPETAGAIANRAKGSTMPNLSAGILKAVPVLVPSRPMQERYTQQVEPMGEMIEVLAEQNQHLRRARDLLLPRLMSGEIEV